MPTVTLKISDDEKTLWVGAAKEAGVSLSEWIRQRCKEGGTHNVTVWPNPSHSGITVETVTLSDPEGLSVHDPEVIRAALPRHPGMVKTDFKQGKKK